MTEELYLPASVETETALLGTLLVEPAAIYEAVAKLRPDDFYIPAHREIFAAIASLSDLRKPVDTLSLCDYLRERGRLQACGEMAFVLTLGESGLRRTAIAHHCGVIKEKSVMRQFYRLGEQMMAQALDPAGKSKDVAATAQEAILESQTSGQGFRSMFEVMTEAVDKLSEYRNAPESGTLGLTTTLDDLDVGTTGIREGELWVVGARPNVGKTPYAMQVAIAQARQNIPVAIFSIEMADTRIAWRCLSHAGIAKPRAVRDPRFAGPSDWSNIVQAPEGVKNWPMWLDDSPDISIRELRHKARYAVARHGVKLIIVDYIGLIQGPSKTEYDRVTAAASGLRRLARETKCPILCLSQLNREAKDLSKEPGLGDLRSTGEIEQSADVVGLIHRPPDPQKDDDTLSAKGYLIMAKVRDGAKGKVPITFDADTLTFKGGW